MLINVIVNRFFVIDAVFVVVRCCLLDLVLCFVFWLFELVCPLFLFLFLFLTLGYCSGGLFFGLVNYDCACSLFLFFAYQFAFCRREPRQKPETYWLRPIGEIWATTNRTSD